MFERGKTVELAFENIEGTSYLKPTLACWTNWNRIV